MRKTSLLACLVFVLALVVGQVSAYAGPISSYFSLAGWNGPMYVDVYATCTGGATLIVDQTHQQLYSWQNLNGQWRVWPSLNPNTNYTITVFCADQYGSDVGTVARYSVWFSGGSISAYRL